MLRTDEKVQELEDSYGNWMQKSSCENKFGGTGRMTKDLYPYTSIFSPIRINSITINNRIVMAPMGNIDMCEELGRPNDKMLQYFFERAKGGVGLITTGLIPISHGIDATVTEPDEKSYFPRIGGSRTNFSGWRDLAQGVHAFGSKIFIQLTPGLGRVGNPQVIMTRHQFPKSASFNPNFYTPQIPCLPLTDFQMTKIIKNCGQAAADAKQSGIDGVYLHGHEGYLLEQCTNPAFNRRKHGKYSDWQRFGIDMVKEMRRRVGKKYPIMYRIDLSLALNETYGEKMKSVKALKKFANGRLIEDTLDYMDNLVKAGVDIFDVDLGCYDNWWLPHPPAGMPAGCFIDIARIAKEHFKAGGILSNAGVEVPVVAVGKLGYPDLAEKALRSGACDMVMLGRPLLSDPEWCNKAFAGKVQDIRPCIGCQEGCINEFVEGGHPQCAVNPRTGFEDILPIVPSRTDNPKKIGVVGAGPTGVIFAVTAAERGHTVELIESSSEVGGKMIAGSVPKIKFDFENYLNYVQNEVNEALEKMPNFTLRLNTTADTKYLKEQGYDTVVFSYGIKSGTPKIPGIDQANYVQAIDLLLKPELLNGAKNVVVIGGGVVGCETAYWLKYEKGCNVKVVEMLENFMEGACTANRGHLLHYMEKGDIELINCATVVSFKKGAVNIKYNAHKNVPNPYLTWTPLLPTNIELPLGKELGMKLKDRTLDADLVVLAMGGRANPSFFHEAQKEQVAPELYNIGDSFAAGRVLEGGRAAYRLAVRI